MWQKRQKKTLFTLATTGWAPEICDLTFPLLKQYARKIDAEFFVITERKFPEWPIQYEKFQIYQLAQDMQNDWNFYIDADALVHPETPDMTQLIPRDTVAHCGCDMAAIRWKYDRFFQRDGRHIGSCNWCALASDLCIELWKPIDDLTPQQCAENILPTVDEALSTVKTSWNLIDDYAIGRNIAKYGLKFLPFVEIFKRTGLENSFFFWHQYTVPTEQKINGWDSIDFQGNKVHNSGMKEILQQWRLV
jgi:hypothetical protein